MLLRCLTLLVLSSSVLSLPAQPRDFRANSDNPRMAMGWPLRGRVVARGVNVRQTYAVEIAGCQHSGQTMMSPLNADGSFSFDELSAGCHQLRVVTLAQREVVRSEMLNVDGNMAELVIDLRPGNAESPSGGFVSMLQLAEHPPRKARAAYERAVRNAAQGKTDAARSDFSRAIELFPGYSSAHAGLAFELEQLNRPAEAAAEWETARRLGVESPELYSGLSRCMFQLNRTQEAENAARKALSMDPTYAQAHYLLALSLVSSPKNHSEALSHFLRAAGKLPRAWLMAARLNASAGDFEGARHVLGEYLKSCPAGERPSVERWIDEMQTRPVSHAHGQSRQTK